MIRESPTGRLITISSETNDDTLYVITPSVMPRVMYGRVVETEVKNKGEYYAHKPLITQHYSHNKISSL